MMNTAVLRHLLKVGLSPLCLVIFLLLLALGWLLIRGDGRVVRVCLGSALLGLLLVSTGWLPYQMIHRLERQYVIIEKVNPGIKWVVVFGGGQFEHSNGPANQVLKDPSMIRLLEGVRLYRQLPHAKLLLSGGSQLDGVESEASHMATLVSWFNIPSIDVHLEMRSKNTMDEALYIKQWVKQEPFYLVTSAFHMKRAMALCQQQGLMPIAAPTDYLYQTEEARWIDAIEPRARNIMYATTAFYETLGLWWARMRGQLW